MPNEFSLNLHALLDIHFAGRHEELADHLIDAWKFLEGNCFGGVDERTQRDINNFVRFFLMVFTQPDFKPAERHAEAFVRLNNVISNVTALTPIKNTDAYVEFAKQQQAFVKILTLYNARCSVEIDREALFDAHPQLASIWYSVFSSAYRGSLVNETVQKNLVAHYTAIDPRMLADHDTHEMYFGSTYVDGQCDRAVKQAVNRHLRMTRAIRYSFIQNRPDPKKVAVITGYWRKGHSVWRTLKAYVDALRPDYHVTLVAIGDKKKEKHEVEGFDEVRWIDGGGVDFSALQQNDWGAVYYPDVGMTLQSLWLSTLRVAPVQLMGTGHPVSTHGSEIDYFVSGEEVEADGAERFYSERLVLLPGMGAVYERPTYKLKKPERKESEEISIACSWYGQKINAKLLAACRIIIEKSKRKLHFRIFGGTVASRNNGFLAYARELTAALPDANVEVVPHLAYDEYMGKIEECDFAIDCFHFGGSNTVSDVLWCGKPVVTLEGTHWYGRIGAALARRAGIGELVAGNEDAYVRITLRMIEDEAYREEMRKRVAESGLDTVYRRNEAASFKAMMDYLIANHEAIRQEWGNEPIRISRVMEELAGILPATGAIETVYAMP